MAKKRSFKKLREHLTSNDVDKKIEYLESRMPTNNTALVFQGDPSNPQGNSFETIVDGEENETDYTVGESPSNSTEARDTSGLFNVGGDHSKGEFVKTLEPPGDTSYVLGPMAAMYYTWSYPWTMVGYIRESDRRMVNLGRIDGKLSDWDGSVGNAYSGTGTFYSYGQLTTEQALWFRDIQKANGNTNDPDTYSYRAYYPGPPSQTADAYGRYPCALTGASKQKPRNLSNVTPLGAQAGDNFSAQNARRNRRGSGMRDRGREGGNFSGDQQDNQRGGNDLNDLSSLTDIDYSDLVNNTWDAFEWDNNAIDLAGRLTRSFTDPIRYGGDKIVKGLPDKVDFVKNWDGGGKKLADTFLGSSDNARKILGKNWYDTDYFAPIGTVKNTSEIDVARQYQDLNKRTRGTPWGPKSGNYWVGDRPTTGKRGLKNPFGSKVSRGFSGTPEIQVKAGTIDAVRMSGDDVAKLATKGAKTSKVLSRLVPGVNIAASIYDVQDRLRKRDWGGAVLGGLSAIPGPAGWIATGGQLAYDAGRAGWFNRGSRTTNFSGDQQKNKRGDSLKNSYNYKGTRLFEKFEVDVNLSSNEKKILDLFQKVGADSYIRQMITVMLPMGIHPEVIQVMIKSMYGAELHSSEEKLVSIAIPKFLEYLKTIKPHPQSVIPPNQTREDDKVEEGLSLERKREIFGHLTKPVVLPETKQKTYKVSPGQRFKNKNKKSEGSDSPDMSKLFSKNIEGPQPFKPQERTSWTKDFIAQNVMKSQEKMNGVLEMIGDGNFALQHAMNDYKRMSAKELEQYWGKNPNMYSFLFNGKKYNVTRKEHVEGDLVVFMQDQDGVKTNMLQSELNEKLEKQNEKWIEEAYFKSHPVIPEKKESTYDMIRKRFLENKKIAPEFPAEPPPKMVNGYHPEYGKKKAQYYKKLDPASANAMPETGDPETDEIVRKQKTINKIKSMRKK